MSQRRRSDLKSGGTEKFRLAPSALAKFLHIYSYAWAPAEKFPEGRKTTHNLKSRPFFGARIFCDVLDQIKGCILRAAKARAKI